LYYRKQIATNAEGEKEEEIKEEENKSSHLKSVLPTSIKPLNKKRKTADNTKSLKLTFQVYASTNLFF
jgi:hypothetical protein